MECFADFKVGNVPAGRASRDTHVVRHVGIVLFNGFALPETASIIEAFQSANAIAQAARHGAVRYEVTLLSASGGRIASSSSVFIWTDSVDARGYAHDFDALFIAGGAGAQHAVRDERLLTWLRRVFLRSDLVRPIAEGQYLIEAAGFAQPAGFGDLRGSIGITASAFMPSPLQSALIVIEDDLGADLARRLDTGGAGGTGSAAAPAASRFSAVVQQHAARSVSEPIRASAQWLEANGAAAPTIEEAARVANMSERNFLRRFKAEMGVTPSDYLMHVRLDLSCALLVETSLPVDKIARRCGLGGGGQLSKLFRKHLSLTPTEFRASKANATRAMS